MFYIILALFSRISAFGNSTYSSELYANATMMARLSLITSSIFRCDRLFDQLRH